MAQLRRVTALAAGALVTALAAPCAAQIYKWTDEKGTVHFSNERPPQAAVEELPATDRQPLVKNGPPPPGEADSEPPTGAAADAPRGAAAPVLEDGEVEDVEVIDDAPDVIVVDDGRPDLVTRHRANSPRNRPGQPIRQPQRQPQRRR